MGSTHKHTPDATSTPTEEQTGEHTSRKYCTRQVTGSPREYSRTGVLATDAKGSEMYSTCVYLLGHPNSMSGKARFDTQIVKAHSDQVQHFRPPPLVKQVSTCELVHVVMAYFVS